MIVDPTQKPPSSSRPTETQSKGVSRILVIDDDPDNRLLVSKVLEWDGYEVITTSSGNDALKLVESFSPDLVFLDISMPDLNALETVTTLRNRESYTALIFLSAHCNVNDVIKGLDLGADDFISKPFDPRELLARARSQIRIKKLHDDLKRANDRLRELVNIDDLTGLFNMRSLYGRLDNELDRARRFHRCVTVVMMDMDYFKNVNDEHDHLFGSFVLSELGQIIRQDVRSIDFAARYGGDEFLIVLPESDLKGSQLFVERLREKIANHIFSNGTDSIRLTASLGFAIVGPNSPDIDARELVRRADRALYRAKEAGRNCVYYDDISGNSPNLRGRTKKRGHLKSV